MAMSSDYSKPTQNALSLSLSLSLPLTFACCAQDDWRQMQVPTIVWLLSAIIAFGMATLVIGLGVEPGPALWGAFFGFAVLCLLATEVLICFAVKRKSRPTFVAAKVVSVGVCFGFSGGLMAGLFATVRMFGLLKALIFVAPPVAFVVFVLYQKIPSGFGM